MPRSENRRGLEVPTVLYERLQAEATRDGLTVTQVAAGLITDGLNARQWLGEIRDELHEQRIEQERMRRQIADLAQVMRAQSMAVASPSIPASEGTSRPRRRTTRPTP